MIINLNAIKLYCFLKNIRKYSKLPSCANCFQSGVYNCPSDRKFFLYTCENIDGSWKNISLKSLQQVKTFKEMPEQSENEGRLIFCNYWKTK